MLLIILSSGSSKSKFSYLFLKREDDGVGHKLNYETSKIPVPPINGLLCKLNKLFPLLGFPKAELLLLLFTFKLLELLLILLLVVVEDFFSFFPDYF